MRRARKLVSIVAISALLAVPASSMAGAVTVYEEVHEAPRVESVTIHEEPRVQTVTIHQEPGPEPNGISMIADFLIARPLGLVATIAGATVYVLALPFAAMAGDIHTPAELLVAEPARFTFVRPLGAIDL
jgi:hypothetical protein